MEQTSPLPNLPTPPQISTTPSVNSPSSNKPVLMIFLIISVLILVSLNAYLFVKLQNQSKTPAASPAPVVQASPVSILNQNQEVKTFQHPQLRYKFSYPLTWSSETRESSSNINQNYQEVWIKSPDASYVKSDMLGNVITKGNEIFIKTSTTAYTNIDNEYNSIPAIATAKNKIYTEVDGQKAIQYDFSFESPPMTITLFIKKNFAYSVGYVYPNNNKSGVNWQVYLDLLNSFKTNQ